MVSIHQCSTTEVENVPELILGVRKATDTGFQKNQYQLLFKDWPLWQIPYCVIT